MIVIKVHSGMSLLRHKTFSRRTFSSVSAFTPAIPRPKNAKDISYLKNKRPCNELFCSQTF